MAKFRLQVRSRRVLAKWLDSDRPKEGDPELVIEVLHSVVNGTWRNRWCSREDDAYDGLLMPIYVIRPGDTLVMMIRLWPAEDPPEFELINIFDRTEIPELDPLEDC